VANAPRGSGGLAWTIPIPEGVLPEEAAFVEPVNTCLKAVGKAGVAKGESVLVVGQGPIGLLLMQIARWAGGEVVASDPLAERGRWPRRSGPKATIDAAASDVPSVVRDSPAVGGRTARSWRRPDGRPSPRPSTPPVPGAYPVVRRDSRGRPQRSTWGADHLREGHTDRVQLVDRRAGPGRTDGVRPGDPVRELVSHRLPIERAGEAFALASRPGPGTLKVVLEMAGSR